MKKINIMIGRFQPFTKGHYKCVETASQQKGIPTVIAMIDTPDNKVDEKHPFPSSLILPLYKELFKKDKNIEDIILVKTANIVEIGEMLKKKNLQIASWTCGSDRIDAYTRMSSNYHDKANLSDDFEMIEIFRTDKDISATKVRQALLDNDKKEFIKLTPREPLSMSIKTDYYETLRTQINLVNKLKK